jgi:hypothetical protein
MCTVHDFITTMPSLTCCSAIYVARCCVYHNHCYLLVHCTCNTSGTHVASLIVTDSSRPGAPDLKSWSPCRPQYLRGLQQLDLPEDGGLEFNITPDSINGQAWSGPDNPLFTLEVGELITLLYSVYLCMRMHSIYIPHTSYCTCCDD